MCVYEAEIVKESAGLSRGKHYYAVKFKTGAGLDFTMRMSDNEYCHLLTHLAGDTGYIDERPHDSEIMKNFLEMIFSVESA